MDVARNKAVVAQFDELGNHGGDLSLLDELCTPDRESPSMIKRAKWSP